MKIAFNVFRLGSSYQKVWSSPLVRECDESFYISQFYHSFTYRSYNVESISIDGSTDESSSEEEEKRKFKVFIIKYRLTFKLKIKLDNNSSLVIVLVSFSLWVRWLLPCQPRERELERVRDINITKWGHTLYTEGQLIMKPSLVGWGHNTGRSLHQGSTFQSFEEC